MAVFSEISLMISKIFRYVCCNGSSHCLQKNPLFYRVPVSHQGAWAHQCVSPNVTSKFQTQGRTQKERHKDKEVFGTNLFRTCERDGRLRWGLPNILVKQELQGPYVWERSEERNWRETCDNYSPKSIYTSIRAWILMKGKWKKMLW